MCPVRTRCTSLKFDSVLIFSFDLALVYNVFHYPLVKLRCGECDEVDIWVIRATGKNSLYFLEI